jgi:MYXO-CTERM domain-containing protein
MNSKTLVTLSTLAVTAALFASSSQAQTYSAAADFSTTNNTASSTWSYGQSSGGLRNGAYPLLPNYGSVLSSVTGPIAGTYAWNTPGLPAVGVNLTGADQTYIGGPQFVWPAGTMLVHPGASEFVVVSWLSPAESNLSISYRFNDMDPNGGTGNGVDWFVERNGGSDTLASGSIPGSGDSGVLSLTNVHVNAGERINFLVGPQGSYNYDSTQFDATIVATPVPEAGTWAMWLAGLGVMGALQRRRSSR